MSDNHGGVRLRHSSSYTASDSSLEAQNKKDKNVSEYSLKNNSESRVSANSADYVSNSAEVHSQSPVKEVNNNKDNFVKGNFTSNPDDQSSSETLHFKQTSPERSPAPESSKNNKLKR